MEDAPLTPDPSPARGEGSRRWRKALPKPRTCRRLSAQSEDRGSKTEHGGMRMEGSDGFRVLRFKALNSRTLKPPQHKTLVSFPQ